MGDSKEKQKAVKSRACKGGASNAGRSLRTAKTPEERKQASQTLREWHAHNKAKAKKTATSATTTSQDTKQVLKANVAFDRKLDGNARRIRQEGTVQLQQSGNSSTGVPGRYLSSE